MKYWYLTIVFITALIHAREVIDTTIGKKFTISLESLTSAGYSWQVSPQGIDPLYIESLGDTHQAGQSNLIGAPGKQIFTFKAKKSGTTTITLEYKRPWEHEIAKTYSTDIVITNKKRKR